MIPIKFKKMVKELEGKKGRHTELVSVYVPVGHNIHEISNMLSQEVSLTQNVKSKSVRKNVISALTKIIQQLREYKKTPPNGLAIFCGNVSESEGASDIRIWTIEPQEPIKVKLYWCDQRFELQPLLDMIKEKEVYALLVMDNSEATIGLLKGKSIEVLKRMDSMVPGKFRKGGQSSARFQRVREGLINDFYKSIAESFLKLIPKELKGIMLGGPGPAKETFYKEGYLPTDIKKKIISTQSLGYSDESGLEELVEKSQGAIAESEIAKEKEILQKFFVHLGKGDGLAVYGAIKVKKAIEQGAVSMVLIIDEHEWEEIELICKCGDAKKMFSEIEKKDKHKCEKCGSPMKVIGEMDIIDAFQELAENYGSEVKAVSPKTREGKQLEALGGIGAILRYRIE